VDDKLKKFLKTNPITPDQLHYEVDDIIPCLSKTPILGCKPKSQLSMFFLIILFLGNDLCHEKQYSHFFFWGSFLTNSILAFGYYSFKDYFVLHYSKKGMFYIIFDQFYFHEKVAWCCHKTCSMLGNHICTSLKITTLICVCFF
jgi:hypothetical protein